MIDPTPYLDDYDFDHNEGFPFGCEHEGCEGAVIAAWWEHRDTRLGVLGCTSGHLEVYEHHERVGRNPCWNCRERPAATEWGSAEGQFAEGGYCSRACRDHDASQRIVRLAFKLFNASGDRRFEALRKIADEASLLGKAR